MMKVSDPIMFGHMVRVYYSSVFSKYEELFTSLGVNPNNGLGDVYDKIRGHAQQAEVEAALAAVYSAQPGLAMVDSSRGITNLHVPSDVIIDASMPCVVRDGGAMWSKEDKLEQVKCVIPDRSYSTMYQAVLEDCRSELNSVNSTTTSHDFTHHCAGSTGSLTGPPWATPATWD